jgi:hypothetical protein
MIYWALAAGGYESQLPTSPGSLGSDELAAFHELMRVLSIILERIDFDNWSSNPSPVSNDGAVPEISSSFAGAAVAKRVSCETSDHADMLEGTGGLCTDPTPPGLTGTLFQVLDADLESLVSLQVLTATLLSPPSVTAGESATYTLSVTPVGGFNQQVSLSCTGVPSAATCSVSPASVTPDGTNAAKATVTVTTTARSLASPIRRLVPPGAVGPLAIPWVAWLLMLATLSCLAAMRRRRVRFSLAVLAATALLMISWAACGGGGGATTTPPPSGTPPGTYTLTLTGTYTSSSPSLTHNTTVSLTVN